MKKKPVLIWSLSAVIYLVIVLAGYYGYVGLKGTSEMNHHQMINHQHHHEFR